MTERPISVLVVDDHPVVRRGLVSFLALLDDIEVTGEASDGEEAAVAVTELVPDVVLMDLVMPKVDGIEAIRRIRSTSPSTRVIVLTSFAEDARLFAAIKAGAAGYLLKDSEPADIAEGIRTVQRGEALLDPVAAARLMSELARRDSREGIDDLTERELEVLGLIAQGMSNRDIAASLVLSEKTVKTHVSNILAKLHLADRTQAALYAVRNRLVELD